MRVYTTYSLSRMKKQKKQPLDLLKTLKKLDQTGKKPQKDPNNKKGTNPFIVLFVIAIVIAVVYVFLGSPNKEVINTDSGLNNIQARYAS